ncbi:hypothetical protein [Streptococcus acidominimus]|uniref:Uncharacterized protein n=1 Tax=Streptococcus acidominimus TaxID=1326 RepID=A0A4Y9FM96_STRAI|nr:hypothetical protein [Streptococcus acidominimus]MBF0819124.1 hypothetical protein [Streptococcus acidominimus]MBF0838668.1 hypothetical protein [Streptococcus acidominimus]MBF0846839.1 hypothetical protein [Streptococcus danieliae]TFU30281.1 hypothetical protein E4U01_06685 [Streptococcus acidominimus]
MVTAEVIIGFFDQKENCWREEHSTFETTEERFKELQERLPGFVEQKKGKKIKKEEVVSDEQPN